MNHYSVPQQPSFFKRFTNQLYYMYYVTVRTVFLAFVYTGRRIGFFLPPVPVRTNIDIFEDSVKPEFLTYYNCENVEELSKKNANISPVFYDRKKMTEIMKCENNPIEKQWRTRILIKHTPFGNIIMFYDAYKGGFTYYSDHTVIPLRVLNVLAMKYVMTYKCLDFFVDETVVEGNASPFIRILNEEDKEEMDKKRKVFNKLSEKTNIAHLPYIMKPKTPATPSNSSSSTSSSSSSSSSAPQPPEKEKRINKFIHLGKIYNFNFLQKKIKRMPFSENSSETENTFSFKNVNYDEYKKKMASKSKHE